MAQAPRRDYDRYEKPTNERTNERTNEPNSTIDPFGKFLRSSNTGNSRSSGSKQAGAMTRFSLSTGISPNYGITIITPSLCRQTWLFIPPDAYPPIIYPVVAKKIKEKERKPKRKKTGKVIDSSALAFKSLFPKLNFLLFGFCLVLQIRCRARRRAGRLRMWGGVAG